MARGFRAAPGDGVAWVTGASSGIGRAVSLELARRGFTVVVTARRLPELEAVAAEATGGRIVAMAGDVTDREAMAALVGRIEAEVGPLALAFLNAGTFFPMKRGAPFDADLVARTFTINVVGTCNALAPVLARMTERGRGQVAINASVAGYGGLPTSAAYGATKAALINMSEALKFNLDLAGVTLQVVNPGFVGTPLTDKNDFPMPFLIEVEDAARRICDGLGQSRFEIAFPRRMAWMLKAINMLPYALYFRLVGLRTGRG